MHLNRFAAGATASRGGAVCVFVGSMALHVSWPGRNRNRVMGIYVGVQRADDWWGCQCMIGLLCDGILFA